LIFFVQKNQQVESQVFSMSMSQIKFLTELIKTYFQLEYHIKPLGQSRFYHYDFITNFNLKKFYSLKKINYYIIIKNGIL
jgi:hypothetical protein